MVDTAKTTKKCHVDGHVCLCDSVHRGGDERQSEGDALCNFGVHRHIASGKANVPWEDKKVVIAIWHKY